MEGDIAFQMTTSNIHYGAGVTCEIGMDLADMGVKNVMVLTDAHLVKSESAATVLQGLNDEKVGYAMFDKVHVEPTDESFKEAIEFARQGQFDGFVAVGGGSTIDTAKAANLYTTYPADFLEYVNAPIGKGSPIPGQLKPLIAVPTTAGTGSETTGVAIFDLLEMHAKTGIAHPHLKPTIGLIDPNNTKTLPRQVAAATGLDVLTHAVESYTAKPYNQHPRPSRPNLRPTYQGSNPISDIWSLQALKMVAEFLPRAVENPDDDEARGMMMLAASYAGIGFGNAGVHLAHGMSYPVSGMVKDYKPEGYKVNYPIIPHGISVVLNAPAVFRFTGPAWPQRHLIAAEALGVDISGARPEDAGRILADRIIEFMQRLGIPNGLCAVGYTKEDIPALAKGTLPQHRVTKLSPKEATEEDLHKLFEDAMKYW